MVIKTGPKKVTFERLYSATIGATNANILAQTTATRLDQGIAAEITHAVIRSPLDSSGLAEAMEFVEPYIDGKPYDSGNQIQVRADLDSCQMPPTETLIAEQLMGPEGSGIRRKPVVFGLGLPDLALKPQNQQGGLGNAILQNTTVKVKPGGTIAVQYKVGNSATTDNTVVELWGYKYSTEEALKEFMARVYGRAHQITMFDKNAMRTFSLNYPAVPASLDNWGKLVGGQDQDGKTGNEVIVKKLLRWARNAKATTANTRYDLQVENDQVDNEYNEMRFKVENDELLVVQGLGVIAGTNHQQTFLKVNDQDILDVYTSPNYNPLIFGRDTETSAAMEVYNHRFRMFPGIDPVFAHGETLRTQILDDGTAIADGTNFGAGSLVAMEALQITSDQLKNQ